jgi:peptidoglycan/xylan/chitin deacetylase (PgdA/CDA1 family)
MTAADRSPSNARDVAPSPLKRPERRVWLTFDDGPSAKCTPAILGILRHHGIKSTFFVVGRMIEKAERVLDQIDMDGHSLGNHSFSHRDLRSLSEEEVALEILRTEKMIARHTTPRKLFRPPYGRSNAKVDRVVAELGYETIPWDVDPKNLGTPVPGWFWSHYGVHVISRRPSSCVLLHDVHPATVRQLDRFLRHLKRQANVVFEPPSTLSKDIVVR